MSKCKKSFCLLFAALMAFMSLSTAFFASAQDAAAIASAPLSVQVEMSKSAYFVVAKAKATVTVKNTGAETLKDVAVSAFSDKHLVPKGTETCLILSALDAGQSAQYTFEMVLNRKAEGVPFFERFFLFFAQLFRKFEPIEAIPVPDENETITQSVTFRHGSTNAVLKVSAFCADSVSRPQVTLLDKYVTDVIKTDVYTIEMEMKENGALIPFTIYEDGNNTAAETTLTRSALQNTEIPNAFADLGKVRFIIKDKKSADPKAYVAWTGGYYELNDADLAQAILDENSSGALLQHADEGLEYCGISAGYGYACETYKDAEKNMQYNFYFSKTSDYEGIIRMEVVNLSTGATEQQIVIRVYPGVTNSNAFAVSGKKYTDADIEKLFGE